jgi:crossover junction endodeoxyribonuclease RusA
MTHPIILPWPPSTLSGHAKGHWRGKAALTKKFRAWAHTATLEAGRVDIPATGDIAIRFTFYPPDNRSDRTNMPNRLKAMIDGISDALGVNDKRFLPSYVYAEPEKPGRVEVVIG